MRSNGHRRKELSARIERLNDVTRLAVWLLVVGGVVAACQDADQGATVTTDRQDATSTTIGDATCVDPPDSELEVDSPLDLTVEPNPVAAGGPATLSIGRGDLPENSISGRERPGNAGRERPGSTLTRSFEVSDLEKQARPSKSNQAWTRLSRRSGFRCRARIRSWFRKLLPASTGSWMQPLAQGQLSPGSSSSRCSRTDPRGAVWRHAPQVARFGARHRHSGTVQADWRCSLRGWPQSVHRSALCLAP